MKKCIYYLTGIFIIVGLFFRVLPLMAQNETSDISLPEPCGVNEQGEATGSCAVELTEVEAATSSVTVKPSTEKVSYVLFHLNTCPHCKDEIAFIDRVIKPKYGEWLEIQLFEVSDSANRALFAKYARERGTSAGSVPVAFIDDEIVRGYSTEETTGVEIESALRRALIKKGLVAGEVLEQTLSVPIIGSFNPKAISLPLLTIVLGLLDGFNPCAMWVLLFLITLLLGMKNKKRMWLLGSIFIFTSGLAYFIFLAAWLELILFLGFITIIRVAIGFLAITVGAASLRDFWKNRKATGVVCKVSKNKRTQKMYEKIKEVVHRKTLWWSIIGILLLGSSVNLIELACSAGFPAIFTQVLALNDLSALARYGYMAGYIFFYMFDDMIVFLIAMKTLQLANENTTYAKYVNAFAGFLMLALGLMLIFKPEWLAFT